MRGRRFSAVDQRAQDFLRFGRIEQIGLIVISEARRVFDKQTVDVIASGGNRISVAFDRQTEPGRAGRSADGADQVDVRRVAKTLVDETLFVGVRVQRHPSLLLQHGRVLTGGVEA